MACKENPKSRLIVKPPAGLAAVALGDISKVQVAEGYEWSYSDGSKHSAKVLQMQTAINPGNSGGPVLDDNGNILGLVAMSEEGQNLDYAIAADEIKTFVNQAKSAGTRGGDSSNNPEPSESAVGETSDGLKVDRHVYNGLTVYWVYESKGSVLELVAESSDGTVLRATKPNEFGGFSELAIELPNHKRVGHRLASWVHRPVRAECGNTPRRLLGRPPSAALRQVV